MSSKWENWIINGGGMPTLDLPEVPPPVTDDVVYKHICWNCNKVNNYWYRLCETCDAQLESEERA